MTKKTRKNSQRRRQNIKKYKRGHRTRKSKGGGRPYRFRVPAVLVNQLWEKQQEGDDPAIEHNHFHEPKDGGIVYVQGTERGGNFCFKISGKTVEATGINEVDIEQSTSLNSGDYPFTFHTHPVVLVKMKEKGPYNKVGNYPNIISADDFLGSLEDNLFIDFEGDRKYCSHGPDVSGNGVNLFDIVAVPYGLFVYRPNINELLAKDIKTDFLKFEEELKEIIDENVDEYLPNYNFGEKEKYYDNVDEDIGAINTYINDMNKLGFIVDFFPWKAAKKDGIEFDLDERFNLDNKYLFDRHCNTCE